MTFQSIWADTVIITSLSRLPRPLNGLSGTEILMAALCETEGRHNGRRGCAFDNELKGCQHQGTQDLRVLLMPS